MKEFLKYLKPKFTSRRERMTYWMLVIGIFMFLVAVDKGIPLLEVLGYYGGLSVVAGWYIQKESAAPSKSDM